ncbi:MAG: hypothetical protein ABSA48_01385 [Terracidiphilus sp.]
MEKNFAACERSVRLQARRALMNRIPTLDGWRGIAIALVLFDHTQAALLGGYLRPWMQTGRLRALGTG